MVELMLRKGGEGKLWKTFPRSESRCSPCLCLRFCFLFILAAPQRLTFVKHYNLITEILCNVIYNEAYFRFILGSVSSPNRDRRTGVLGRSERNETKWSWTLLNKRISLLLELAFTSPVMPCDLIRNNRNPISFYWYLRSTFKGGKNVKEKIKKKAT